MYCCPACCDAIARIKGGPDAPQVSGEVRFYQECGNVLLVAELSGMPTGGESAFFVLHIHDGDSCGEGVREDIIIRTVRRIPIMRGICRRCCGFVTGPFWRCARTVFA